MDCQKHLFSIPEDLHYLNCAFMSPLMRSVIDAGEEGIYRKKQPWNIDPEDFFNQSRRLRELYAGLIHAPHQNDIAILPSVSYGISTIAKNLPCQKKGKIIVVGEQFPSNVYPWMRYCKETGCRLQTIHAPSANEPKGRGKQWNRRILEAIDSDTLVVALGHVHWTDGTLFQLDEIGRRVRETGGYLVIDGTQSVGALPFNVQEVQPDALICAGYKWLLGPYSTALGYFGKRLQSGIPLEEGWLEREGSKDFTQLVNYTDAYQPGAIRFDVGENSNFILVPMLIKALEQLIEWGPGNIQRYCRSLTNDISGRLSEYGYGLESDENRSHHLFGIYLPDHMNPDKLHKTLCQNNIHVSIRGSALRVSPNVYNDRKDIDAMMEILENEALNKSA